MQLVHTQGHCIHGSLFGSNGLRKGRAVTVYVGLGGVVVEGRGEVGGAGLLEEEHDEGCEDGLVVLCVFVCVCVSVCVCV